MTARQPPSYRARLEPVDVLAVLQRQADLALSYGNDERAEALQDVRAAIAELIEAAHHAHMALIGYLPAHRNAVTDEAIAKVSAALARAGGAL